MEEPILPMVEAHITQQMMLLEILNLTKEKICMKLEDALN